MGFKDSILSVLKHSDASNSKVQDKQTALNNLLSKYKVTLNQLKRIYLVQGVEFTGDLGMYVQANSPQEAQELAFSFFKKTGRAETINDIDTPVSYLEEFDRNIFAYLQRDLKEKDFRNLLIGKIKGYML